MPKNSKPAKQLTLDKLPVAPKKEAGKTSGSKSEKRIIITEIAALAKEDELALKVAFKLFPSKTSFSKVQLDLWFNNQQINSISIRIPQGSLSADEFELTPVLDMKGIPAGSHTLKVEMYELWSLEEKLYQTFKELTINYVPYNRETRFVKVPSVKSIAGTDLAVVLETDKEVYREIEKTIKKEYVSKRDYW